MEDKQNLYWSALAKYFSGNASEEDKILIQQKRNEDPSFEEAYRQAKGLWQKPSAEVNGYEPDVETAWQRLHLKARMRTGIEEEAKPVDVPARGRKFSWAIAASIVFLLALGALFSSRLGQEEWVEVQTALRETKTITLPDGSRITLNENSIVAYPEKFQLESREVRLKGEAFFEVQKAEGKRFTVYAQDTKTEVIGTKFYLEAYPEEEVRIQVTEGKVAFASTKTEEAIFLTPGEEAIMGIKEVIPLKQKTEDVNFQAWQNKKLVFENTNLNQLVRTLEQYFETSISIQNKEAGNCRFTVSFENPELKEVLEVISLTGNLSISREGETYIIKGGACN